MEKITILVQIKDYRVCEIQDDYYMLDSLKGDCFCPISNPDRTEEELEELERAFEKDVNEKGVYGYVLEKWNPEIGCGWEQIESCWGFVGSHETHNRHYIVDEFERFIEANT